MGITRVSEAEDLSQQLQEHGQPLAHVERLVAEKKETLLLCGIGSHDNPEGKAIYADWAEFDPQFDRIRSKATNEIEQDAATFVVIKGQKGGRQQ